MKCEDVREYLPDFLAGEATGERRTDVEAHLAVCPACRKDVEMWARMGGWPDEQPSPALRERFDAMLSAYRTGLNHAEVPSRRFSFSAWIESWWPSRPAVQFAVALLSLAAGLFAGYGIAAHNAGSREISRLREEVHDTRQLVAVSLLQQQSASERLQGVNWSYRVERPDTQVLAALVHALKYDNSVDVRLAAGDALRRYTSEPMVRRGIAEALRAPQSPLVQVTLIDLMVETRMPQTPALLRDLSKDTALNGAVRQRADWGLQQF